MKTSLLQMKKAMLFHPENSEKNKKAFMAILKVYKYIQY